MRCFQRAIVAVCVFLGMAIGSGTAAGETEERLRLTMDGKTDYAIVKPKDATLVDDYAVNALAHYLREISGAEFPIVDADSLGEGKAIFVGISPLAAKRLGEEKPLVGLKDQEHVSKNLGDDIFLYGEGPHGNFHAVMEFLENSLGWRWYSVFDKPLILAKPDVELEPYRAGSGKRENVQPKAPAPTIALAPFNRRRTFSFPDRLESLFHCGMDFYYQNLINMGYQQRLAKRRGIWTAPPSPFVSDRPCDQFVHTSFKYVCPHPDHRRSKYLKWLRPKNYFELHPDYFSMNEAGEREPKQLCFSNPALRDELTRNIERHAALAGEDNIITLDAEDNPG